VKYLIDIVRPAFFAAGTGMDTAGVNRIYQLLVKTSYLFNLPVFFFLVVFDKPFVLLVFGSDYAPYAHVLTAVYFFRLTGGFDIPVNLVAQIRERADVILYSKVFAVYNLIANFVLIRYLGIWGAVLATGTAVMGKNLFIWYFVREAASFRGIVHFFLKTIVFWAVSAVIAWQVSGLFESALATLSTGIAVFALAFILQFRMPLFNEQDRRLCHKAGKGSAKAAYFLKLVKMQTV
jgi:O-antigen/teichoic acid export membrane protein